jgi:hypothetical protein
MAMLSALPRKGQKPLAIAASEQIVSNWLNRRRGIEVRGAMNKFSPDWISPGQLPRWRVSDPLSCAGCCCNAVESYVHRASRRVYLPHVRAARNWFGVKQRS